MRGLPMVSPYSTRVRGVMARAEVLRVVRIDERGLDAQARGS